MGTAILGDEGGTPGVSEAERPHWGAFPFGAAVGLAVVEIVALKLRIDTSGINATGRAGLLREEAPWVYWALDHAWLAFRLGMGVALTIGALQARRLRAGLARCAGPSPWRWSWPALLGHVATVLIFGWLSVQLFEGPALSSAWRPVWLGAWLLTIAVGTMLLVATVLAPRHWGPLIGPVLGALGGGAAAVALAIGTGFLFRPLWKPLGTWTTWAVAALLGLTGAEVVRDDATFTLGTGRFAVHIAPQCSGYEGIGLVCAFLAAYLWVDRGRLRFPRAWLVLPIGVVTIWLVNAARIAALILIGGWISPEVAVGGFHSQAGWIGFLVVALGLVFLIQNTAFFQRGDAELVPRPAEAARPSAERPGPSLEAVHLAPMLAIVAAGMLTAAVSPAGGFDYLYPLRLVAVAVPLWFYRRHYAAMRWSVSWRAFAIGGLVFAIWNVRGFLSAGGGVSTAASAHPHAWWISAWIAARCVGSIATVPFAEELAFRGFLSRWLIDRDVETVPQGRFTVTAFLGSSLAFGLLHGERWIEGTIAGMLFAGIYYRRGSIGEATAAHATTNGLLSIAALATGDWSLWS